ncbi:hypothetical protein [Sulfurirhabdus autotrophica]|uniref:Uncharacterized protein n=1 Tax=Sulfurirhabdus autotrophica TaxID=1706046 RepID=A0A4V2W1M4_9PROT|nr:hypothetical protein [Sulfurirhabdus autotrophica]TCV84769.1 hypothetical protein EDC63_111115 [Sulfurirhabdus autotrophica]
MKASKLITAGNSRSSAQMFTIASLVATIIPPLLMIWIAASIFVYASIAHHPNPKVAYYNRIAGYRFYSVAGAMVVFGQPIYMIFNNWHGLLAVWAVMAIVIIPWGIWDLIKAQKDEWQDMVIEVPVNE